MNIGNKINNSVYSFFKRDISNTNKSKKEDNIDNIPPLDFQKTEESCQKLDSLVGLDNIKELINEIKAFVMIDQKRRESNLKTEPLVFHMIFSGNPGTGKTTIARILGELLCSLNILDIGHVVEVERADLVGEFVGQTAQKVKAKVNEALGGILFIDEAYSLARGSEKDFGKEAIDTLVKAMEDHKDEFILILAGYQKEMQYFLMSNPGLQSRFPLHLKFNDYTVEELMKIAEIIAKNRQYELTLDGKRTLYNILIHNQLENNRQNCGNAREVRNIIEKAIRKQALRLSKNQRLSREDLMHLKSCDFK